MSFANLSPLSQFRFVASLSKETPPLSFAKAAFGFVATTEVPQKKPSLAAIVAALWGGGEKMGRNLSWQRIHVQNKSRLRLLSLLLRRLSSQFCQFCLLRLNFLSTFSGPQVWEEEEFLQNFFLAHVVHVLCLLSYFSISFRLFVGKKKR